MSDPSPSNVAEFTVSELSFAVKRTIEGAFEQVRVRGELGRVSRPGSGHVYLDLKDQNAVLSGVIWKGVASRLQIQPEQGLEVIATGRLTTFPGQSRYQIVIDSLEPAGAGALMALLEERRKKLAAEGLFDAQRKQLLPDMPAVIGVVTSPSGAVIRDILHRISDRFPLHVLVWPCRVQGEQSSAEVAAGIAGFNALPAGGAIPRPDVIIVARGGGSVEDLWGYNDEQLVRVAAASDIPLISAVGHETDWTLMDHVADVRAPTPTAAAELAVPVRAELLLRLSSAEDRLFSGTQRSLERSATLLRATARGLPRLEDLLDQPQQRLDMAVQRGAAAIAGIAARANSQLVSRAARLSPRLIGDLVRRKNDILGNAGARMNLGINHLTDRAGRQLDQLLVRLTPRQLTEQINGFEQAVSALGSTLSRAIAEALKGRQLLFAGRIRVLDALSYTAVLKRGFALVRSGGVAVTSASAVAPESDLEIEFQDGRIAATVGGLPSTSAAKPTPAKPAGRKPPSGKDRRGQGELF